MLKTKRVKKKMKDQEVALDQEKNDNIRLSMKLRYKGQKKDKEVVSSVFQTNITDACKLPLSSNQWDQRVS